MYGYYKSPFGWFFIFFKNHIQKRVAVKVKGLGFISEPEDNVKPFSFLPPSYNLNDENKIILQNKSREFRKKLMENYTNIV